MSKLSCLFSAQPATTCHSIWDYHHQAEMEALLTWAAALLDKTQTTTLSASSHNSDQMTSLKCRWHTNPNWQQHQSAPQHQHNNQSTAASMTPLLLSTLHYHCHRHSVWQQLLLPLQEANQLCVTLDSLLEKTQQLMDMVGKHIPALTAFACTATPALFIPTPCCKLLAYLTQQCHYPGPIPSSNTVTPCPPGKLRCNLTHFSNYPSPDPLSSEMPFNTTRNLYLQPTHLICVTLATYPVFSHNYCPP